MDDACVRQDQADQADVEEVVGKLVYGQQLAVGEWRQLCDVGLSHSRECFAVE